jgi:EAL domain-containing protein (putative c-di-GMP-specific phosphodiesterase class I)
MEKEELFLVYQPKVNVITNKVIGVETLLRWDHPAYGFLSPGVFIPILEENNRMIEVTNWVIEKVCRQMSIWRKEGISFQQVAINIPGQYVTSNLLLDVLKSKLNKYKLEPNLLELEITETSFVKNIEEAMRAVSTFRQEGFSVALDDFGTGVSSLSYLKKMPISTLKIDKSFIDDVPQSEKDSSIIQAIIALGESLDLAIVFEGVETKRQVDFLATTCENPIIQGYYFAKPMKADELFEWNKEFEHA